jgi:hypothetical protein
MLVYGLIFIYIESTEKTKVKNMNHIHRWLIGAGVELSVEELEEIIDVR